MSISTSTDQRCTDERLSFARYLTCLQDELKSGRKTDGHMKTMTNTS